jgi:hypothetical protein
MTEYTHDDTEYYIIYLAKKMRPDLVFEGLLPEDLQKYLLRMEKYAEEVGGSIQSRQVVALALATWEEMK